MNDNTDNNNQRQHEREELLAAINLYSLSDSTLILSSFIIDISINGYQLYIENEKGEKPLSLDENYESVLIKGDTQVTSLVKLVRVDDYMGGLKIIGMDKDNRKKLHKILSEI